MSGQRFLAGQLASGLSRWLPGQVAGWHDKAVGWPPRWLASGLAGRGGWETGGLAGPKIQKSKFSPNPKYRNTQIPNS